MFEFNKILAETTAHTEGYNEPCTITFPDPCTVSIGEYTGKFCRMVRIYYYNEIKTFDINVQHYFEADNRPNNSTANIVDECLIRISPDGIFQTANHSEDCWFISLPSLCYIYPTAFHRIDNDENWSVRKYCKNGSDEPNAIDFRVFDISSPFPSRRIWYDLFESPMFNFDGSAITVVKFKKFIFDAIKYVGGDKNV